MCTQAAVAMFQIIGTIAEYQSKVQHTQMENARREENRRMAAQARDIKANQLAIRVKQEQDVKSQQEFDNQIAVMEAKEASKLAKEASREALKAAAKSVSREELKEIKDAVRDDLVDENARDKGKEHAREMMKDRRKDFRPRPNKPNE